MGAKVWNIRRSDRHSVVVVVVARGSTCQHGCATEDLGVADEYRNTKE